MRRPCLTCGQPATATRCPACTSAANRARGSATQRGYGVEWRSVRDDKLSEWVATYGPLCPGWQRPAHYVAPESLSGDHITPLNAGGSNDAENVGILCIPCNSAKRDRPQTGGQSKV